MAKRKYTKKSEYWGKFDKNKSEAALPLSSPLDFEPEMVGESFYESAAACSRKGSTGGQSVSRTNSVATGKIANKYANIDAGLLPFEYSDSNVGAADAISLCQKAYFNIPAFRSTIDLMSQYANTDIYLEGGSKKSRKFIEAWFKRIKIHDLQDQFFREFYRSGNVFMLRLDGTLDFSSVTKMMEIYGSSKKNAKIPIKYIMVNPSDIVAKGSVTFSEYQYYKVLTPFEISRLKNPTSDHERELFNSMPDEVKLTIKNNPAVSSSTTPIIPLEPEKLHVIFAGKQDYEPMAIPSGFAVLDDLNKKMELKKIDQAIARSIENVVLLVTMGAEPDKGGVNHKALSAMQNIFKNQSVGRVLVSDYTTKAEFVIPDLKKVMGAEKYQVLDQDIKDGLQNILIGDSKYSQGETKMRIFLERLKLSRELFIKDFIQPEIRKLCKSLGMRVWPQAKMVEVGKNESGETNKIAIRMMELGILTPEQGMDLIHSGSFPESENLDKSQKSFKKQREDGHYMPLVNSINLYQQEEVEEGGQPNTSEEGRDNAVKSPSPSGGRPIGVSNSTHYSKANIVEITKRVTEFEKNAAESFSEKFGIKELSEDKKDLVAKACESIVVSKKEDEWDQALSSVLADFDKIADLDISPEVLEFGAKHQLDDLSAAILYHSTKI